MPVKRMKFQPGLVLYEVVTGALRTKGTSLEAWSRENGLIANTGRNALYGASSGATAQKLLDKIIDVADRDVVELAYRRRLERHSRDLGAAPDTSRTGEAA